MKTQQKAKCIVRAYNDPETKGSGHDARLDITSPTGKTITINAYRAWKLNFNKDLSVGWLWMTIIYGYKVYAEERSVKFELDYDEMKFFLDRSKHDEMRLEFDKSIQS